MSLDIGLISLGCSKNQVDSELMLGQIDNKKEFNIINDVSKADIIIINTCGFIQDAKNESIETILKAGQLKKDGSLKKLIVTGCLTQRYKEEILNKIPEIDAILGTGTFDQINQIIDKVLKGKRISNVGIPSYNYKANLPRITTNSHFGYVKIAEGCSNNCSYCSIPQIRGPYYSRAIEDILDEINILTKKGIKEIILIAQDITRYGLDIYGESSLVKLIKRIMENKDFKWLRLMYIYPENVSDELIELIAREERICNYMDLPIQHSSNKIRNMMNRRGSRQDLLQLIYKIRNNIPDVTLRTSLIVGFPGEGKEEFNDLKDFVQEVYFERLGVFKYSKEENTPAASFKGHIETEIIEKRYKKIMEIQQEISYNNNQGLIGEKLKVIIDEIDDQTAFARSQYDAPEIDNQIYIPAKNLKVGDMVYCHINEAYEYDLIGELLE